MGDFGHQTAQNQWWKGRKEPLDSGAAKSSGACEAKLQAFPFARSLCRTPFSRPLSPPPFPHLHSATVPRMNEQCDCFCSFVMISPQENPSQCVPFITGGSGWNLDETMQKATAWNMPITPAVAKDWTTYTKLPLQVRSTFYWWVLLTKLAGVSRGLERYLMNVREHVLDVSVVFPTFFSSLIRP